MKIIFMGTPDFAVPTLKKLYDSGYEVHDSLLIATDICKIVYPKFHSVS